MKHATSPFSARLALLLAVVLCIASPASAQFAGRLTGTVQDSSGAVIPGATVTLVDPATQQTRTATTAGDGGYSFGELPPGSYHLTASAANFTSASIDNLKVGAETRSSNITLTTGGANDTVTVNADTQAVMQTSDASIGSTLDSETLQRLPAAGGDVYELLRTAPGITGDSARSGSGTAVYLPNGVGPGQSNSGIFQTENQIQISAAGQQVGANNYMIDGVSVNSLGQAGAAVVTPNQESVSQLSILSTSYSAEDGRNSGAQIKIVSKSGTNTIHGSAYLRYDEPGLNAYNRVLQGDTFAGPPVRNNNKQRDYAASLGGPILKNKLFLFASYEGYKSKNNSFSNQWIETPAFDAAVIARSPNSISSAILKSGGVTPRIANLLAPTCSYYIAQSQACQIVGTGIDVGSIGPASNNGTYFANYNSGAGLDGIADLEYAQLLSPPTPTPASTTAASTGTPPPATSSLSAPTSASLTTMAPPVPVAPGPRATCPSSRSTKPAPSSSSIPSRPTCSMSSAPTPPASPITPSPTAAVPSTTAFPTSISRTSPSTTCNTAPSPDRPRRPSSPKTPTRFATPSPAPTVRAP